jgi:proteasome accessory factor B
MSEPRTAARRGKHRGSASGGSTSRAVDKLQRWLDLLAALLVRRFPVPFDDLAQDVPAYRDALESNANRESVKRTFERDKDELRAFGVPIESLQDEDGVTSLYRLRHRDFYLPYLAVAAGSKASVSRPKKVDRYGYHGLPELTFEPDELAAIAEAAERLGKLGAPQLAEDARSAVRKLSHDLPIGPLGDDVIHDLVNPRTLPNPRVFAIVAAAVARRKELRFVYRSMEKDIVAERRVRPYGVFFHGSNGYLVGHDLDRAALRNFRLSRMQQVAANDGRPNSPDFEVPASFDLRAHARSADAWELGDSDAVDVSVRFLGNTGYADSARQLGTAVDDAADCRRFHVRRQDVFARWLLSFGGDAIPIEPPEFVDRFRRLVRDTLALYECDP